MEIGENLVYPKISIVTPSFNQGAFIEDTILSVIGQQYPNLEYIIIDGGSSDETVEIIKKYEKHIAFWVSEKDKGQSHAINKGFAMATGDILGWLNSDDMYLPGTLMFVSKLININLPGLYFGNCMHYRESEYGLTSFGSDVVNAHRDVRLTYLDYIIQPSSFLTKVSWERCGALREDYHFGFDWEWFLRAEKLGIPFHSISRCLSVYRLHDAHKTAIGGKERQEELLKIYVAYCERAGVLYKQLMAEKITLNSFRSRCLVFILKILDRPRSIAYILRRLAPNKYKTYTVKEINEVRAML